MLCCRELGKKLFSLIAQGEFIELDEIHALQMVHISRNTIKAYNCRKRVDIRLNCDFDPHTSDRPDIYSGWATFYVYKFGCGCCQRRVKNYTVWRSNFVCYCVILTELFNWTCLTHLEIFTMVFRNKVPKKRPDIESKSALELLQEERECEIIKTNISRLDQELSGGIRMVKLLTFI